jgi:hypothetical protein
MVNWCFMDQALREFLATLDDRDRMLLDVLDVLYVGRWEDLVEDLQAARDGRPYVFKVAEHIEDDLKRVRRMHEAEKIFSVRLKSLLGESHDDKID